MSRCLTISWSPFLGLGVLGVEMPDHLLESIAWSHGCRDVGMSGCLTIFWSPSLGGISSCWRQDQSRHVMISWLLLKACHVRQFSTATRDDVRHVKRRTEFLFVIQSSTVVLWAVWLRTYIVRYIHSSWLSRHGCVFFSLFYIYLNRYHWCFFRFYLYLLCTTIHGTWKEWNDVIVLLASA